jgi:phage baseplate assembly protein V
MVDVHGGQTMIRRVRLKELTDSGTLQTMRLSGLKGEELDQVPRIQPFGLSTNPPVGSEGLLLALGGRSDRGVVLGVESPDHRPTGREPGSTILYDANGNVVSIVQAELRVRHATQIVLQVGGVTLTLSSAGLAISGGTVTHDGKNISKTHVHTNVQGGAGNSGPPA